MSERSNLSGTASDLNEQSLLDLLTEVGRDQKLTLRPTTLQIADWQLKEYFGWTDEEIEFRHRCGV